LIDTATNIPVGTVFAIAPSLLLTANHNRLNPVTQLPLEMSFAKFLRKKDGVITPPKDKVNLKVLAFHAREDWVIFERADSEEFLHTATLCEEQDLPDENSEHNVSVTVRFYNIGLFEKKLKQLHHNAELQYYQECKDVLAIDDDEVEAEIIVERGAVRGVCGAPYYFNDKVVAFHVESNNEALEYDKDNIDEVVESLTTTHSNVSVGRVLCRLPAFMELYRRNFKIETVETHAKATCKAMKKSIKATKKDETTVPNKGKRKAVSPVVAAKKRML
jgi:hypothetical protein